MMKQQVNENEPPYYLAIYAAMIPILTTVLTTNGSRLVDDLFNVMILHKDTMRINHLVAKLFNDLQDLTRKRIVRNADTGPMSFTTSKQWT